MYVHINYLKTKIISSHRAIDGIHFFQNRYDSELIRGKQFLVLAKINFWIVSINILYFLRPEKVAYLFINVEPKIESTKFHQLN